MFARDHNATVTSDIVVEVRHVSKVYRQRQRGTSLRETVRSLVRPTFRDVTALGDVSFTLRRGEIVAYAGPNGAGKSTTIKLLSGLLAPDAGEVRVLGYDPVRDRVGYVSRIGVVFGQRTELWWDHPVEASFEWKRAVWNVPRPHYERTLRFLRDLLGLDEFFHTSARLLSLGQKMRADLALALLHEPEILFLDEPTLGLDVLAKRNVLGFVKALNREKQVTVVVTSHDMSDLEQLAGRIVMIHKGRLAFDGDFAQLRRGFADRRRLLLEAEDDATAPIIDGAELVRSEPGRHEYVFDASRVRLSALLEQASSQTAIRDVETHRVPIDDVIADIYARWQQEGAVSG